MYIRKVVLIVVAMVLGCSALAHSEDGYAAIVKFAEGDCTIVRGKRTIPAAAGMKVFTGDLLKTAANGKIGLIFEDDSVISLGPNSRIVIENFLFRPADKQLNLVARLIKGTLSMLSGQIAKLAPDQVRVETPDATIGFRGTHILVHVR